MQLLEITITGIAPIGGLILLCLAVGGVVGGAIVRNNYKAIQADLAAAKTAAQVAQNELNKIKATASTVASDLKKV